MKKIFTLAVFLLLYTLTFAQLGTYGVTINSTVNPPGPWSPNQTVQFCITVSDFTNCQGGAWPTWFDGLQLVPGSAWGSPNYVSAPAGWRNANQATDIPWQGWGYNYSGSPNSVFNEFGVSTGSGPYTFCVEYVTPAIGDLCWASGCDLSLNVYVWGDDVTGGCAPCSCGSSPDGPYVISNFVIMPVDFIEVYAVPQETYLNIGFKVENERNVQKYDIEIASVDLNESNKGQSSTINWRTVDFIQASGRSNYYIKIPANESDKFLRIKGIDINGETIYSPLIEISVESQDEIKIFPNPIKNGILNIAINNTEFGEKDLKIISSNGKIVYNKSIITFEGGSSIISIDGNIFTPGIYILVYNNKAVKFIKN